MGLVAGVHRDDDLTAGPFAQKTSRWGHAEIRREDGKVPGQRSEYAQGSVRNKSEKGKEAAVTKELIEQVLALGGDGCIELLLADALYADGPLLAWLKYIQGIDALVALPADRLLYHDLQGLARGGLIRWTRHRYVRTVAGHKQRRVVEVASAAGLTSWDSFTEAASQHGADGTSLWGCLIRQREPETWPLAEAALREQKSHSRRA
jgi:hypothetical protein